MELLSDPVFCIRCVSCFMFHECEIIQFIENSNEYREQRDAFNMVPIWEWFSAHCSLLTVCSIRMKIENSENMIYVRHAWICFVHSNCLFRFSIKQYFYFQSVPFFFIENFDFVMQSHKKNWNEYK